tara:strand:- start:304 stop:471 length:168 start_codon:yes stop_codon:yes gene_type:complete
MTYEIEIKEVKKARFAIEAESLKEAKEQAHWRLITQTRPSIKSTFFYNEIQKESS